MPADDPFLRWGIPPDRATASITTDEVIMVINGADPRLWIVPSAAATTDLVGEVLSRFVDDGGTERHRLAGVCIPQPHAAAAHRVFALGDGGDWDWMWSTTAPPAHPLEDQLVELDDRGDAEMINSFAAAHNPRVWSVAGSGRTERWLAAVAGPDEIVGPGHLLAVGGLEREASGAGHLAGIVTHAGARRAGWGTAISTALTRGAVAADGVCTLGMYADNDVARRVYQRLGYRTAHRWHSRRLAASDRPG